MFQSFHTDVHQYNGYLWIETLTQAYTGLSHVVGKLLLNVGGRGAPKDYRVGGRRLNTLLHLQEEK